MRQVSAEPPGVLAQPPCALSIVAGRALLVVPGLAITAATISPGTGVQSSRSCATSLRGVHRAVRSRECAIDVASGHAGAADGHPDRQTVLGHAPSSLGTADAIDDSPCGVFVG
jgi:hypothetical protein